MAFGIKIIGSEKKEYVDVYLDDVLSQIDGEKYFWTLFHLEARGDIGEEESIVDLEERVAKSDTGLRFKWKNLNDLAKKFDQVIDVVIVGCENAYADKRFSDDQEMYDQSDIVVEMVDSSYWLIHASEELVISEVSGALKRKTPEVTITSLDIFH